MPQVMDDIEFKILPQKSFSFGLKELWQKKELLYFFVWRDIKVKYRQTYLGILWAVLQPVCMMGIFYLIFSRGLHVQIDNVSYIVYTFSGLILWGLLSAGISNSSESMISNASMLRKIYFPRLIIPLSALLVGLIDFIFGFIALLLLLLFAHQPVSWTFIYCFPLGILMALISSFGIGSLLAALNVKYRDFRYILPFAMQLLFFSSQIVYSIHNIETGWLRYVLYCLPFNGALEIFHYPLNTAGYNGTGVAISVCSMVILLFAGLRYFKKTENYFADLL